MNSAFVACTAALCGPAYLLGLEDIIERGQCAATARQPPLQDGVQASRRTVDPLLPEQTKLLPVMATSFSQCILEQKRGENPLAGWAKATS